jgi:hypothetical protein
MATAGGAEAPLFAFGAKVTYSGMWPAVYLGQMPEVDEMFTYTDRFGSEHWFWSKAKYHILAFIEPAESEDGDFLGVIGCHLGSLTKGWSDAT